MEGHNGVNRPVEPPEERSDSISKSSLSKKKGSSKKNKRRLLLPGVLSSLDRSFPLSGPDQIKQYLRAYDRVELRTWSSNPQKASSTDDVARLTSACNNGKFTEATAAP